MYVHTSVHSLAAVSPFVCVILGERVKMIFSVYLEHTKHIEMTVTNRVWLEVDGEAVHLGRFVYFHT